MTTTATTPATAWTARADDLAAWALARYVVRSDVWGGYNALSDRAKQCRRKDGTTFTLGKTRTRPDKQNRGKVILTRDTLARHFRATAPVHVVGIHTTCPANVSRFGVVEIDAHGDAGNPPEVTQRAALAWYDKATAYGFRPLLWDSDGKGGYHLDLLLADPVPTGNLYWWLREFVADFAAYGLTAAPETFPKQPRVNPDPAGKGHYGNWCRLVGRHHTHDVWATVWDGARWLAGADAVAHVLSLTGAPPTLIPADTEMRCRVGEYRRKIPNLDDGQGRDNVAFNFLAFMVRDLALSDADALRYAGEWDADNRPPKGPERLREILANVHEYARNPVGSGLGAGATHTNGNTATGRTAEILEVLRRREETLQQREAALAKHADANLTDVGNGLRFAAENAAEARYVPGWGWVVWDGRRWARDQMGRVYELAKETVRRMYSAAAEKVNQIAAELKDAGDDKAAKEELKKRNEAAARELAWALKSEDAKRIDALLKMARTDTAVVTPVETFDADASALNVNNGTIDLATGKLKPHDRADYITKLAPVEYKLSANAPTWDRLLSGIWDRDMDLIRWNQRLAGYAATGDVREQIVAIFHGAGGNGKTTYVETVLDALGDYAYKANAELLLASKSDRHETEKAALAGRRFVAACETGEGRRLNEPLVKETTGGDRITARFMKQDHFTFAATFKVILCTNHRPEIRGTDVGIWRRVRLVPFNVRFWKPGETPGPEHLRADPTMRDKLRAELPGVLNWIVAGAVEWYRDGLGTCPAVEAATADYRSAEDIVSQWVDERCERDATETKAADLFANYVAWAESRKEKPLTRTMFGTRLGAMEFGKRKTDGAVVYQGLRLKSQGG